MFVPDPKSFLWIAASAADLPAVNLNGTKMLLVKGLNTFLIKGKSVFNNGPRSLLKNTPNCIILDIRVFEKMLC